MAKNVLFWVGYQRNEFDGNSTKDLGGTEIATINVAENLALLGYNVVVSGQVKTSGVINNVEWINTDHLDKKYFNKFDIIVSASYMHFVDIFKDYTKAKLIFWAHNTDYFPYLNGKAKNYDKHLSNIDAIVCLTEWHSKFWKEKYNSIQPTIIGNGIDKSSFNNIKKKEPNSFIWSSALDRDVFDLLDNWYRVLDVIPDAKLNICYPHYSSQISSNLVERVNKYKSDSINVIGTLDQTSLHNLMERTEYWCYLTNYEETYCITALEMQYANVIPIVTKVAALNETVPFNIKLKNDRDKWDKLIEKLQELNKPLKRKIISKNRNWAKQQTWHMRALQWKDLFESLNNITYEDR